MRAASSARAGAQVRVDSGSVRGGSSGVYVVCLTAGGRRGQDISVIERGDKNSGIGVCLVGRGQQRCLYDRDSSLI
jgi:hypothetical protein